MQAGLAPTFPGDMCAAYSCSSSRLMLLGCWTADVRRDLARLMACRVDRVRTQLGRGSGRG